MKKSILYFFLLLILATGCTFKIQALPSPDASIYVEELNYDAAIFIPPNVASQKISRGGLCLVGVVHSWDLMVGPALSDYSQKYFSGIFKSAVVYNKKKAISDNKSVKIIIEPYIKDLNISQGLNIDLVLHCTIEDQQNSILYERSFTGKTQGTQATGKACLGGVFLGESALRDSFGSALGDAFKQLIDDLRQQNNWDKLEELT